MLRLPIYMDNHATTRVDPRVLEAMLPFFDAAYGNPSSRSHVFGREAQAAVEAARGQVAALIGAEAEEIVFTSGATEADNLAILGTAEAARERGDHVITSVLEHEAVLNSCRRLEAHGFRVTYLPADSMGQVRLDELDAAIEERTILVSLMFANNEIGVLNPIAEIGELCRRRRVLFHSDASQACGKVPVDVREMKIDLLSCSAHKMYGPKGVGALYVRRRPRVPLAPQLAGGGQERGLRSGTLNVPAIVGFGEAARVSREEMETEGERLRSLRNRLREGITARLPGVWLNGHPDRRLPGSLNLSFDGVEGEALLAALGDIAVSSGSACTSASLEPSYVLRAIGRGEELADGSLRFGLGRFNTGEEVDYVADRVVAAIDHLRRQPLRFEDAADD